MYPLMLSQLGLTTKLIPDSINLRQCFVLQTTCGWAKRNNHQSNGRICDQVQFEETKQILEPGSVTATTSILVNADVVL